MTGGIMEIVGIIGMLVFAVVVGYAMSAA